ncbi:RCS-specific HTH-type transcriptional activator RclR [Streptomyces hundungensis]|uniref:RCS-specific HTH-type transcriptional activator RclR n=1 Tax=Streptomyces hundungensis TaxID=1077946 RepID=A0A387HP01_9ACTN|nr:AraC family transcriptional regulator [Streptomyces hundungensis]AYG82127.1 RCS-specific HTH-type transcriptional activator RclR [Streptomyces hundungensis]
MDLLSDAIVAVRVGRPSSTRLRVGGRWCARLDPYEGAGFHVVLEGSCWMLTEGGAAIALNTGDAVLLPHGSGHVIADRPADGPTIERAVDFAHFSRTASFDSGADTELLCGKYRLDRRHTHPLMADLPDVVHIPRQAGRHDELRAAIALLGHEAASSRPGGAIALPSLLDLLLVHLVRAWMADSTTARWPAALHDPVVAAALHALHEDPARGWSNERLAAHVGVSRATLARRFTALVGRAPMGYLTWWRLTRAAALLRATPDGLDAIARHVGYSTPYALSHAFSRQYGTTPGRYRAGLTAG